MPFAAFIPWSNVEALRGIGIPQYLLQLIEDLHNGRCYSLSQFHHHLRGQTGLRSRPCSVLPCNWLDHGACCLQNWFFTRQRPFHWLGLCRWRFPPCSQNGGLWDNSIATRLISILRRRFRIRVLYQFAGHSLEEVTGFRSNFGLRQLALVTIPPYWIRSLDLEMKRRQYLLQITMAMQLQGNAYRVKEDSLRVNWNRCEFQAPLLFR